MRDDIRVAIDALFPPAGDHPSPGGVAAVVEDGVTIYRHAFGLARTDAGLAFTPSTPFHVCSVSKTFTAALVCLLATEGRLDLEAEARRYLPELADCGAAVRLIHMLNNVSGLRDDLGMVFLERGRQTGEIDRETLDRLALGQRSLMFAPGERYSYSNSNFHALGRIIEAVENRPLPEVMQARILGPLGMSGSEYRTETWPPPEGGALGHRLDGEAYAPVQMKVHEAGAGGLWSTLDDLVKWTAAWSSEGLGAGDLFARLTEPGILNDGTQSWYAKGFGTGVHDGARWFGHAGGLGGMSTNAIHMPDRGLSFIAAFNGPDLDAETICFQMADLVRGGRAAAAPAPAGPRRDDLAPWSGVFQTPGAGLTVEIEASRAGLTASLMGWSLQFTPSTDDLLTDSATDSVLRLAGPDDIRLKAGRGAMIAFRRVAPADETGLARLAGRYESPELRTTYLVKADSHGLSLAIDGPCGPNPPLALIQAAREVFQVAQPSGAGTGVYLTFAAPDRLTVSMSKSESVPFRRVA